MKHGRLFLFCKSKSQLKQLIITATILLNAFGLRDRHHARWFTNCISFSLLATFEVLSLIGQLVKNPLAIQETSVQFLGQEDLLEKG